MHDHTPPPSFVKDLVAYDPALRCRWGKHTALWFVERKMAVRNPAWLAERPLNPFGQSKRAKDLWAGWRDGYCHVLSVHPSLLHWQTVAPELARSDREQAGSWDALNRRIEDADAAMDQQRERALTNWSEAAASEGADRLMWLEGHRQATPMSPSGVESSDAVEQHPDGFMVRVRKGVHRDD